jgi:hypothetical protein
MYKKILGLISVAGVAAAVFFTTSMNKNTSDMSLKTLVSVNTANAECSANGVTYGRCLTIQNLCVADPAYNQCSF